VKSAALDPLAVAILKLVIALVVLALGFSHVSDDDYARTVIAQSFAHSPRLDPSGTSWLPLPFWITGAAMAALGRSIEVARGTAVVLSIVSAVLLHLALRRAGVARAVAFVGVLVAMATPWNAWLSAAPVPESFVPALLASCTLLASDRRAAPLAAVAVFAASLSRYEAWPVCACFAVLCAWRLRTAGDRAKQLFSAAIAVAGPI
jgi:hypothetical protein